MILAISRFRVSNGTQAAVAEAFARREGRVDGQPGFLGLEVFTDAQDEALFDKQLQEVVEADPAALPTAGLFIAMAAAVLCAMAALANQAMDEAEVMGADDGGAGSLF